MSSTGTLPAGTLIAGRYEVHESLGGEASAAVYRADDTRLDRAVALRLLAAAAPNAQQGRAAARLLHPNVARVLDFGMDAALGAEYVVADLGTGGSLAALLSQRGAPPLPLALRMIQEAAAGLAAAHRAGLVHGDLHPGVLWLSRDEGRLRVQVLGLGLNPAGTAPPRATARYASPERLRRADLSTAADVFSLGAVAHEVFAGLPADWNQLLLGMARGQTVVVPSLLDVRPELPPHVAHAVRRALATDPAARWPEAGELAAALIADAVSPPAAPAPIVVAPAPAAPQTIAGLVEVAGEISGDEPQTVESPETSAEAAVTEPVPVDAEPWAESPAAASSPDAVQPIDEVQPIDVAAPVEAVPSIDAVQPIDASQPIEAVSSIDGMQSASFDEAKPVEQIGAEPIIDIAAIALPVSADAEDSAPSIEALPAEASASPEIQPVEAAAPEVVEAARIHADAPPAEPEAVSDTAAVAPALSGEAIAPAENADAMPQPEPAKPVRQPMTAGRRPKTIALASTDLADTLYIPPPLEKPAAPAPAPASAAQPIDPPAARPAEPAPVAAVAPPTVSTPPVAPAPSASTSAVTPAPEAAAPTVAEETRIAPVAPIVIAPAVPAQPAPAIAEVAAAAGDVPASQPDVVSLPERRRTSGMQRMGQSGSKRGLIAAGIAITVLVTGGVVARTLLAGGPDVPAEAVNNLASRALASAGGARPAGQPQPAAPVDSAPRAAPAADSAVRPDAELSPEERRKREEERRRLEEQRRLQQRQQDSLRQAQLAAAQQAASQPVAAAPQQVAVATAPRPAAPPAPAPRVEAPAPEPERPRVDANRTYELGDLDSAPSLANASAFRAAVQRTYPSRLRGSGVSGNAVVTFTVLPDGRVDQSTVTVVQASNAAFRPAASAAMAGASFTPGRVNGQAVRSQASIRITWQDDGRDDD